MNFTQAAMSAHGQFSHFSNVPVLHSLPPGCKFLNCHEMRDVLQSCPTYRLPNGSVVTPVGGELYQVLEIPANYDEHCVSPHQAINSCPASGAHRLENSPLHNNEWLRFRSIASNREDSDGYSRSPTSCPRMPVFYTDGRVCPCQFCVGSMYPERHYEHRSPLKPPPTLKLSEPTPAFSIGLSPLTSSSVATLQSDPRHQKQKRFQCNHCEKSFGKSSHLRDHIRTHTGDRPFRCQYCNKAFTQYSNLRTHTRIHTGEKPFKCQHCSKSFTQAVTLRSHTRTHTGDKPYNCKRCTKSFACFSGLKGHNRIHSDADEEFEDLSPA